MLNIKGFEYIKNNYDKILFYLGYFLLVITDSCKSINVIEKNQKYITLCAYFIITVFIIINMIKNKAKIKNTCKIGKILIFFFLIVISLFSYVATRNFTIIRLLMLIFAVTFLNFDNFIITDLAFKACIFTLLIILPVLGIIDFNYLLRADHSVRYAFGFEHPNSLSMYLLFIVFEILYIVKRKKISKKYYYIILGVIPFIIAFIYFVCNSRVYAASLLILYMILLVYEFLKKKSCEKIVNNKVIFFLIKNEFLIFMLITLLSIFIFNHCNDIGVYMDKLFSNRYTNYNVYIKNIGFSLMGKERPFVIDNNAYLDNMYLAILINFGFIQSFYYLAIYYLNNLKAKANNDYFLMLIFFITCIMGFTDTNVIIPTINIFLLYFAFNIWCEHKKERRINK